MFAAHNLRVVQNNIDGASMNAGTGGLTSIFRKQPTEHLRPGQSLFFEGDVAKHLFSLVQGDLRICHLLPDGRRVITGFLRAGDIVGVSFRDHYLYGAEAINTVTFRRMMKNTFEEELAAAPHLRPEILSHLRDEVAAAQDQMVLLSRKNAEERLCSFLMKRLRLGQGNGSTYSTITLPMNRLDVADYLGLTIETVSRTMTKLSSSGIAVPEGRHGVRVLNEAALALHAGDGEDYGFRGSDSRKAAGDCRH